MGGGGVLLPLLPCDQKDRQLSSHFQSHGTKYLSPRGEVQNGNPGFNFTRSTAGHVNDLSISEGRLSTHPDPSTAQEVPEIHIERSTKDPPRISMGSPSVRVGNCPQSIHQAFSLNCGPLASQEYVYVQHLPCSDLQGCCHSDSRRQCSSSSPARICDQPSKVFPDPFPGDYTPRHLDRHPQRSGQAVSGQGPGNQSGVC